MTFPGTLGVFPGVPSKRVRFSLVAQGTQSEDPERQEVQTAGLLWPQTGAASIPLYSIGPGRGAQQDVDPPLDGRSA